jgi:hypothetical protein
VVEVLALVLYVVERGLPLRAHASGGARKAQGAHSGGNEPCSLRSS